MRFLIKVCAMFYVCIVAVVMWPVMKLLDAVEKALNDVLDKEFKKTNTEADRHDGKS
jgi:hypothetical protein